MPCVPGGVSLGVGVADVGEVADNGVHLPDGFMQAVVQVVEPVDVPVVAFLWKPLISTSLGSRGTFFFHELIIGVGLHFLPQYPRWTSARRIRPFFSAGFFRRERAPERFSSSVRQSAFSGSPRWLRFIHLLKMGIDFFFFFCFLLVQVRSCLPRATSCAPILTRSGELQREDRDTKRNFRGRSARRDDAGQRAAAAKAGA